MAKKKATARQQKPTKKYRSIYILRETAYRIKAGHPKATEREDCHGLIEFARAVFLELPPELHPKTGERLPPMTSGELARWKAKHRETLEQNTKAPDTASSRLSDRTAPARPKPKKP